MRKVFLDYDARREPKTDRYCIKCQRDLKPGQPTRIVRVDHNAMVLHPADANGAGGEYFVGLDCAKQLGLEFSVPE